MAPVLMYTKKLCPYCIKAKSYLHSFGVTDIEEKNIETNAQNFEEFKIKSNGRKTVPQIFIGEKHIGGCDDLHALDKTELALLLNNTKQVL